MGKAVLLIVLVIIGAAQAFAGVTNLPGDSPGKGGIFLETPNHLVGVQYRGQNRIVRQDIRFFLLSHSL